MCCTAPLISRLSQKKSCSLLFPIRSGFLFFLRGIKRIDEEEEDLRSLNHLNLQVPANKQSTMADATDEEGINCSFNQLSCPAMVSGGVPSTDLLLGSSNIHQGQLFYNI
jgi:hypothetical protein